MARKKEHLRVSKILLGTQYPIVHTFLDEAVKQLGAKHRYLSHNVEYLDIIEKHLGGKEAKREAMLHLLQDWGVVTTQDINTVLILVNKAVRNNTASKGTK